MNTLQKRTKFLGIVTLAFALLFAAPMVSGEGALAETECNGFTDTYTANVVVLDTPMVFNRLGAQNPNWFIYALRRDVINIDTQLPLTHGGLAEPGRVALRPDKRPRPLVLRIPRCSKLEINFENLLFNQANQIKDEVDIEKRINEDVGADVVIVDDQVKTRFAGVHVAGMQLDTVKGIGNDSSYVGANDNSCVDSGGNDTYTFLAEHEGAFKLSNPCAATGGQATGGNNALGMWGMVAVQPKRARIYRSQVYEEEYRLAADANFNGVLDNLSDGTPGDEVLDSGHPIIDYEARYPTNETTPTVWDKEGKGGLPILNMMDGNEIVHSEVSAIVAGPNSDGSFPTSTYPLENVGIRNPSVPNRLEAFRDWAQMWHDEAGSAQAFEGFFSHPVLGHTLHGVRDAFMINYASGGIGSEIIANRLGVGPMYDCLGCAYEEFFLTSFTVGDPGMRVDVPANFGLENVSPETVAAQDPALVPLIGPKATTAFFQDDPANIHNSYTGDFAKFRNVHMGPKEQHIFHLHNHQWLFNANDDRANYLDAQGIGPGSSYTYEINFGGSGNRNKTAGDAIFHCHFYPHFAQGMWYHWRIHDVTETGTILEASLDGGDNALYHDTPFALGTSKPALQDNVNTAFGPTSVQYVNMTNTGLDLLTTRNRAHPDGEILAGIPIPAVVPMPGKPMAPMPGDVVVVTKDSDGNGVADSSQNYVVDRTVNPGYPFWIAGLDCSDGVSGAFDVTCAQAVVGQRPPTPPLDMATQVEAADLLLNDPFFNAQLSADTTGKYTDAFVNAAGGFNGGLPRHSIGGCKDASVANLGDVTLPLNGAVVGCTHAPALHAVEPLYVSAETRLDFHKEVKMAKGVFFPEGGTDLEKLAMGAHATREHPSTALKLDGESPVPGNFILNGLPPVPGAPFNDPCISDTGQALVGGQSFDFFAANGFFPGPITAGRAWDDPFTYAAANIQIDAVFNKVGYHYPQQRIIALWGDVEATISKAKAPEPFVMRLNTFNCAKYQHSNLVPKEFEVDDYQVRTPTDIIGQHIHLPKWDLTTADGAANGWNYEDGTLSPGMVQERIEAINAFNDAITPEGQTPPPHLESLPHPALGSGDGGEWDGGRVTLQRWLADPVVDRDGIDRGLGIIFTHDHYGPSTHQQIGLYSTLLTEPAESTWVHNETGTPLGTRQANCGEAVNGLDCDGGPTSWQAAIIPGGWSASQGEKPFREFYFEFSDFQHAYEAGIYVGAGPDGRPFVGAFPPAHQPASATAINDDLANLGPDPVTPGAFVQVNSVNTAYPVTTNSFRHAINPSVRQEAICKGGNCPEGGSPFPDIVRFPAVCDEELTPRPCPEAITADDSGMFVVNYRNEPVGLRVFDPNALGPDNNPGTQAAGLAGDLAFALQTRPDRVIPQMNTIQPAVPLQVGVPPLFVAPNAFPDECAGCTKIPTDFPPPINAAGVGPGDPFTPLLRAFAGDDVKIKIQAGGHEHEHNATVHGVKWVQGNSGHGPARPAAGWRNSQNDGISEQFNFSMPIIAAPRTEDIADYAYSVNASQDGWWTGVWGILRSYNVDNNDAVPAPLEKINDGVPQLANANQGNNPNLLREFVGVCPDVIDETGQSPVEGQDEVPDNLREYQVVAVMANELLNNQLGATITGSLPLGSDVLHEGGPLDPDGGTLVYNPRGGDGVNQAAQFKGPLHDPTALLYVRTVDLVIVDEFDPACNGRRGRRNRPAESCFDQDGGCNFANLECEVRLADNAPIEPLVLRANPGECVEVTLFNRLSEVAPDLAGFNTQLQVVIRDRQAEPQQDEPANSVTTFNNNLIRPSSYVGLHPQLVSYDVTRDDGVLVGMNPADENIVGPGDRRTYRWYVGDLSLDFGAEGLKPGQANLVATPVEFGGSNLTPADKIKQGQKAMIGALIVEPVGAVWNDSLAELEQVPNRQDGGATNRGTRADMFIQTGTSNGTPVGFADLVLMKQSGLNHRHKDGAPVPNIAGEGGLIPEDSHDAGQQGANYGSEPAWFRFGKPASVAFGNAGAGLGAVDAEEMFSNVRTGGFYPWTPVFTAPAGQQARIRMLQPTGVGRGSTFDLHGHVWARDPYLPENPACLTETSVLGDGITPLAAGGSGCGLSSVEIGFNPLAWYLGGQESWTPLAHFDIVLPEAGGAAGVTGDYLIRDHGSFGVTDGVWGIMRVD